LSYKEELKLKSRKRERPMVKKEMKKKVKKRRLK